MRFSLASFFCLSSLSIISFGASSSAPAKILETAPLRFEPNAGLRPSEVRWIARGQGYSFAFTDRATVLRLADRTVKLTFPGARASAQFHGESQQSVSTNYFMEQKRLSVPAFSRLRESEVYRGIDVIYYGNGREMEYDFEIAPGSDPSQIRMRFEGADAVRLNDAGEIILTLGGGEVTQRAPVVYQKRASGEVATIAARYQMGGDGTVRLVLDGYDPKARLIVDPTITYTAYLSGTTTDTAIAIAHDAKGIMYLAGNTASTDFPAGGDVFSSVNSGGQDIWLMKLDPSQGANAIVYSTFLGSAADDTVKAMAIDQNGVFYVTGSTLSAVFPTTPSAIATTNLGKTHAFVTMLDPSQGANGLIYSTYLSGTQTDEGDGITVAKGKIYVTGSTNSDDFPLAGTPFQSTRSVTFDAFVAEIDPTLSGAASEVFATYLGGSGFDAGRTIAVDAAGLIYVGGSTYSFDFPLSLNAYQPGNHTDGDAFLAVLNPADGTLAYSTYLGGSSADEIKRILIDPAGRVAMAGYTLSYDFPVSQNAYQPVFGGVANAFLAVLDLKASQAGSGLIYSTFYGGTGGEVAYDLKIDSAGRYYLCGYTLSRDLPVTPNALNGSSGGAGLDGFIAVIDPAASPNKALVYASYVTSDGFQIVYGIDVDAAGNIYATGFSTSNVFPGGLATNPNPAKYSAFVLQFTLP
jgi:hypothetical protein